MRNIARGVLAAALVCGPIGLATKADAGSYEDLSARRRALYTAGAAAANVAPVASTIVEPKCLQGYILCKATFAAFSVIAAAESLVMSGGSDLEQPRSILTRGFSGDWVATPQDVAGTTKVEVLPDAAPPAGGDGKSGDFVPPPL